MPTVATFIKIPALDGLDSKLSLMSELKNEFNKNGYFVVKNSFTDAEIQYYIGEFEKMNAVKSRNAWTVPDGVVQQKAFWPIIFKEELLARIREVLGDEIRFMQHNDLHYGYSSFAWHRDSINRGYAETYPDWQEDKEPYLIVRAGCYLQPEEDNFCLGVLPGSHRFGEQLSKEEFCDIDSYLTKTQIAKAKLGLVDHLKEKAVWIKTQPGDCIVFDPRLIHTGGGFERRKYSFFTAYGVENFHFRQHYTYYRHLRKDLGYEAIPSALVNMLKENGLYATEEKYNGKIEGAWVPSNLYSFVANFFE